MRSWTKDGIILIVCLGVLGAALGAVSAGAVMVVNKMIDVVAGEGEN